MKLAILSDLHLDHDKHADAAFLRDFRNEDEADLVILAGDVYSTTHRAGLTELFALMRREYENVIFVPGNHDVWLNTPEGARATFEAAAGGDPNIHLFVEPGYKEIAGQRFLGGTMWYPKPSKRKLQRFIDMDQTHAPSSWFFDQYQRFRSKLEMVKPTDIVITHHLPHPMSTPLQFRGSKADHFFMTNLTGPILDLKPKLWVHGHTHDACDYVVGETRIVCNPRGYPFEWRVRAPYKPKLIEIP